MVTERVPQCDAVIAGTLRSRHDQRQADRALVVFAGGASCAARCPIGANEERSALVIVTGALNVLVGGAAATSHREEIARKARQRGFPGPSVVRGRCGWRRAEPQWRSRGRWCSCLEWPQAASGGAQSAATLTNRPGLRGLRAAALRASSVKRDPRGPSGRRGGWRSIATESSRA